MDPSEIESREKAKVEKKRKRKLKHKPISKASPEIKEEQQHQRILPPVINGTHAMTFPAFHNTLSSPFGGFAQSYSHPMISDCANLFSVFLRGLDSELFSRSTASNLASISRQNPVLSAMLLEWTRRAGIDRTSTDHDTLKPTISPHCYDCAKR